ncbi:MAG: hypothetical protein OH318_01605 [Candidatus Parvarchaeota archaeon]|nr:hypothetical protein [Candidatus Rehaiarchaeum fermentans]MCW1293068.1 hypothetical protein [Candidatus Rehaiarchaeum fermentans]
MILHLVLLVFLVIVADFIIITVGALLNELSKMGKASIPRISLAKGTPYFLFLLFLANYVFTAVVLGFFISTLVIKNISQSVLLTEEYISDIVSSFYAFSGLAFLVYIVIILRKRTSLE